jgi:hypothetical protein
MPPLLSAPPVCGGAAALFVLLSLVLRACGSTRVFPAPYRPQDNPLYGTVQAGANVVTYELLNSTTPLFTSLRGFSQNATGHIVDYEAALARYAPLGNVVWPVFSTIFAPNVGDVASFMASQGFFMTDLWGFVPGSGPGGMWTAYTPPPSAVAAVEAAMGPGFFGFDVGEQDGRFIGGFADQHGATNAAPLQQRANFEAHFQAMYTQLTGRVVALQSLTFLHYMCASGVFTIIGSESAQGLPNAQLFYAVVRGAGKQYGVLWFGNVSVYNRWGYKTYPAAYVFGNHTRRGGRRRRLAPQRPSYACSGGSGGPTCGTSLSLMAKLLYAQILYNSGYVGFESSWFAGAGYSPIGELQLSARAWLARHGSPGAHMATVALLVDAAAGWTAPRHLYSQDLFRVWGNLPYSVYRGDYLTDALYDALYPGYRDSSFFRNETGFSTPTPYGDCADVLTMDAPPFVMQRYDTLLLAGTPSLEAGLTARKLAAALSYGTNVLAFAGALGALQTAQQAQQGLGGCRVVEALFAAPGSTAWTAACRLLPANTSVTVARAGRAAINVTEGGAFQACTLACSGGGAVTPLAWLAEDPATLLAVRSVGGGGAGAATLLAAPFGAAAAAQPIDDPGENARLGTPFPLLSHALLLAQDVLAAQALFSLPGLTWAAARLSDTAYTLVISNPTQAQAPLAITPLQGAVLAGAEPLAGALPANFSAMLGYLPDGSEGADLGATTPTTLAGVDTVVYRVTLAAGSGGGATPLPTAPPPRRPRGLALNVRDASALGGAPGGGLGGLLTSFPSLPQLVDTLLVDAAYVAAREGAALAQEARRLAQVGVGVAVDFSGSETLFAGLRLCNNSEPEFSASLGAIQGVLEKMGALGWRHALLSLHRTPENNMDAGAAVASMAATLHRVAALGAASNVTLHFRPMRKNPEGLDRTGNATQWLAQFGGALRVAPNTAELLLAKEGAPELLAALRQAAAAPPAPGGERAAFLGVSCARSDIRGYVYTTTGPVAGGGCSETGQVAALLRAACGAQGGACLKPPSQPGDLRVVLVVDAFLGDAVAEGPFWAGGAAAGAELGGGDKGARELQWVLDALQ